jgi:hypothetical protein
VLKCFSVSKKYSLQKGNALGTDLDALVKSLVFSKKSTLKALKLLPGKRSRRVFSYFRAPFAGIRRNERVIRQLAGVIRFFSAS